MKELYYRDRYGRWTIKHQFSNDDSEVKEWEGHIARTPNVDYKFKTVGVEE